ILIVAIVGETVYEDEQAMFTCNTLQPGCHQACYDQAFPISHIRYWVFQIILVCTPSLCFITYAVHRAAKRRERRGPFPKFQLDGPPEVTSDPKEVASVAVSPSKSHGRRRRRRQQEGLSRFYAVQVLFRNALELGFLGGQYLLYGFRVPASVECGRYPCVRQVECYVSRPTEKTV
ncbi:CXD2 protein, partial [Tyrannus savana]|nr:CXD2 protein [Tyrannus savana]